MEFSPLITLKIVILINFIADNAENFIKMSFLVLEADMLAFLNVTRYSEATFSFSTLQLINTFYILYNYSIINIIKRWETISTRLDQISVTHISKCTQYWNGISYWRNFLLWLRPKLSCCQLSMAEYVVKMTFSFQCSTLRAVLIIDPNNNQNVIFA